MFPLLCSESDSPVGDKRAKPVMVNDSGTGSTMFTVKMDEWLMLPLTPVIVMLYFPRAVCDVADTCKLEDVVPPGVTVSGFWPPMTPRNPKGVVA